MQDGVGEAAWTYRMAATLREVLMAAGAHVTTTVRSESLEWRLEEGKPEGMPALPRDAVFGSDGTPVRVARNGGEHLYRRADVGGAAWRGRSPGERVVFLSVHFDAVGASQVRGAVVKWDPRGNPPAISARLGRWLEATGLSGNRRSVDPQQLGVLAPERNPVPERVLLELANLTNAQDRAALSTAAWRWRAARVVAAALAGREPPAAGRSDARK